MPFADYDYHLQRNLEYQKTPAGKAAHAAANKRYRQKNKQKLAAHNAVAKARASGKLVPWPVCAVPDCSCIEVEAHHPDYSRPLDVVWLCSNCHVAAHNIVRRLKSRIQLPQGEPRV